MKIGIDIDNVLNSMYKPLSQLIRQHFNVDVDTTNYNLWQNVDITDKEIDAFLNKHSKRLNTKPEWRCTFFINELRKNNTIYIITARKYNIAESTIQWLKQYKVPYDGIYFNAGNKLDVCKFLKVDYMIDDSPWVLRTLNYNNIKCLAYNRPYNKSIKGKYIQRVNDWQDIYVILS